jgi:hypothetical protein
MNYKVWEFEAGQGGDIFLVNQFLHPYAGGLYFASARSNNFNFYWSMLSAAFGSMSWEALGEAESPASSDVVNTLVGGIGTGEMLHRLFMELDKGGIGYRIAGSLLSPTDRITAALRGYGPEEGASKIFRTYLNFGFSWSNAHFLENDELMITWNRPSAFVGFDLVYGNPFLQETFVPYEHFEFQTMLAVSLPLLYNFNFVSDGYLASWMLAEDEANLASHGLSLHFDDFIVDKNIDLNNGTENVSFNANSVDYTVKWYRRVSGSFAFSLKSHLGFTGWAIADYNGGLNRDDYYCYLMGANVKTTLELTQIKQAAEEHETEGQSLTVSLRFYDTWKIPGTPGFDMNAIFGNAEITWALPFTKKFSFYASDSFSLIHCNLTHEESAVFPDITRWYNCAKVGLRITL